MASKEALLHLKDLAPQEGYPAIPEHLITNGLAVPLEVYAELGGWSEKTNMFVSIAKVAAIVEHEYGMQVSMPKVTPLTHQLWEEWLANGKQFTTETRAALTELLDRAIAVSDNNLIVIRHLEDNGHNENVGVRSYPGVTSAEDGINKIEAQFKYLSSDQLQWQNKGNEVEVSVGIYPHADPPAFETTTLPDNTKLLTSGQPPVGIVVTTSQNGEKIEVSLALGDNLAAQENPAICDVHYFTFADPTHVGKASLERSIPTKLGARDWIEQDRGGDIVKTVKLPSHMLNRPISFSETEIIRAALVAAVAAKEFGHDVKVEAQLNQHGLAEINSLAWYEPRKVEVLSSYETEYLTFPVINNESDARALYEIPADDVVLPPAIIFSDSLKSSIGIGESLEIIEQVVKKKIEDATTSEARECWNKTLILATGSSLSHHLDPLLQLTSLSHYIAEELPATEPGDTLIFETGRHPGSIWIRNRNLSGDGTLVISPEHWAKAFPARDMGNKAFNHREVISRNSLPSPEYLVLMNEGFLEILAANGLKDVYVQLLSGNGPKPIKTIFQEIRQGLKTIPDVVWNQITDIMKRQVPNWQNCRFLARSNSTIEDEGAVKRYAGSFASFNSLSLSPETSTFDPLTGKPTTLAGGILSVIASMFSEEMATHLGTLGSSLERKRALINWAMPVKIDLQKEAIVSGVSSALDAQTGSVDYLTVQAQAGIGGVVEGELEGRPILTALADRQTMQIISLTVKYKDQQIIQLNTAAEISDHFPPELSEDWLIAIMNATAKVHKVSGKKGLEWAIDHEENQDAQLWINQSR